MQTFLSARQENIVSQSFARPRNTLGSNVSAAMFRRLRGLLKNFIYVYLLFENKGLVVFVGWV